MGTARAKNARNSPRTVFAGIHVLHSSMTIEGWMPSEIEAISPLVDQLMRLIEGLRCVAGDEFAVELALREALSNAVIHGNGMDAHRSVEVRCRCEQGKGLWLTVKDQGKGFDPTAIADPLASRGLEAERGRGIHLMKLVMDEVSFKRGGTEVHMRKRPGRQAVELPSND